MHSPSTRTSTSLAALPTEVQTRIYEYCYPTEWCLNVHPSIIQVKLVSGPKASHTRSQGPAPTSCSAAAHPRNPSAALLLACRTIRDIAQPILQQRYNGVLSICTDTIVQSERFTPDLCVSNLISWICRKPWVASKTHTLAIQLEQFGSLFTDYLYDELQYGEIDFLPCLESILLKDDAYCYVSRYYGAGGLMNTYRWDEDEIPTSIEDSGFEELCHDLAEKRIIDAWLKKWGAYSYDMLPSASIHFRWIPDVDTDGTHTNPSHERGREFSIWCRIRFRLEHVEEQAYEAMFTLEKWDRPNAFDIPGGHLKFTLSQTRKLTSSEDEGYDWNEAVEADLTSLYEWWEYVTDRENSDDLQMAEYLEDEYL